MSEDNTKSKSIEVKPTQDENSAKRYLEKLDNHLLRTEENITYALNRYDILIISLSSGGLGLSIGLIKTFIPPNIGTSNSLCILISCILFSTALVSNLFSQVTSYFANEYEQDIIKHIIRVKRGKSKRKDMGKFERLKSFYNNFTQLLNGLGLIAFVTAIIFLLIFVNHQI